MPPQCPRRESRGLTVQGGRDSSNSASTSPSMVDQAPDGERRATPNFIGPGRVVLTAAGRNQATRPTTPEG